jgi:glycerate kinase
VVAVVGSVAADLGGYARNFSELLVASDAAAMYAAGKSLAWYSRAEAGRLKG